MTWLVQQTRRFARQYKKLHDNTAIVEDAAVDAVAQDPEIGERKKGDLPALPVVKFRSAGQLFLLGYTLDEGVRRVWLDAVAPHGNFIVI